MARPLPLQRRRRGPRTASLQRPARPWLRPGNRPRRYVPSRCWRVGSRPEGRAGPASERWWPPKPPRTAPAGSLSSWRDSWHGSAARRSCSMEPRRGGPRRRPRRITAARHHRRAVGTRLLRGCDHAASGLRGARHRRRFSVAGTAAAMDKDRVNMLLDALDDAYDHVVITGRRAAVRDLFTTIEEGSTRVSSLPMAQAGRHTATSSDSTSPIPNFRYELGARSGRRPAC